MTPDADWQPAAALVLGLLGSSHCLVMCGGIGAALGMGTGGKSRWFLLLLFQLGRIASYSLLALTISIIPSLFIAATGGFSVLRILAGLLLISMGFYIGNWWRGLVALENIGQLLWRQVQPLTQRMLPVTSAPQAIGIGLCWGLLPCGLIYTALVWSASASGGEPLQAALLMACFGLGTLPSMYLSSTAGKQLMQVLQSRHLRRGAAIMLMLMGLWTILGPASMQHGGHGDHGSGTQPETVAPDHDMHQHG
ncbi:sulfite exporter TauE/SafE family protein [Candidatus Litorirhabdus singularis]|nr:sulfite exporter TauE/SafE family protein [Candidatus Litorirhabdus singularis]